MDTIGRLCNREVVTATADTTVTAVARLLRQHHVGCVVIVESRTGGRDTPVGIVTDRDVVVEVTAVDLDPAVITAGDIMAEKLYTVNEAQSLAEAMATMRENGVRRLPVVNKAGKLVGIITADDIIELVAAQLNDLTQLVARERGREAQARR